MAEIVQSLFGVTPEMYQQNQQAQADQQALQYAKLSPFEQANFAIGRGATMLGGAIGRGLGGEDPELARVTARQQIASQINFADPKSIMQGVDLLRRSNDTQGAMMLADVGRRAASEDALAQQRLREKAAADPFQKLVESGKYTPASLADFQVSGKPADLVLYEKPEKPENLRSGEKREAVANELYDNRSFKDLTPKEKAVVNKRLEDEEGRIARESAPKIYPPGQQIAPKDWENFTLNVLSKDPVMQRTSNILSDAPSALEVIRTSTLNDLSAAALPGTLSRLVGKDSSVSNLDIERFARTGGLDDRLAQDAVKFFTGKATEVKKDQAEKFTIALYRGALLARKKKLITASEEFGYETSPNYKRSLKNIDDQLSQFTLVKQGESIPRQTTQSDDDLLNKYAPAGKK